MLTHTLGNIDRSCAVNSKSSDSLLYLYGVQGQGQGQGQLPVGEQFSPTYRNTCVRRREPCPRLDRCLGIIS